MSEKNESTSDVPAENNSADFFTEPSTSAESKSTKNAMPWAAIAAFSLVAAVGGFALGQTNGFDGRPAGAVERMGLQHMGEARPGGQDGFGDKMGGRMHGNHIQGGEIRGYQGNDGPMDGKTPHCHDANGQDVTVGTDGKCADGTLPMQRMDRYGQMNTPTPIPSTSSSTLTN